MVQRGQLEQYLNDLFTLGFYKAQFSIVFLSESATGDLGSTSGSIERFVGRVVVYKVLIYSH